MGLFRSQIKLFSKNQIKPTSKMQISTWVFNIVIILLLNHHFSEASTCSETDRAALNGFRALIFKDTTEILSSWTGKDCCNGGWEGIQCDAATGRVTGVLLQRPSDNDHIYMKGTLSPSLANLKFLEVLVISGMKKLSGTIPSSFANLTHLTQLVLEDNSLEGTIPSSLGHLPLKTLSLSGNRLIGPIPSTFTNINNLIQLNLARNSLSGTLFPLAKLMNLQYLDLSYNMLSGNIPSFLGQQSGLTFLDLSNNRLSGHIPDSLCDLTNLLDLSLSNNLLTGQVPHRIGQLKSLTTLSLSFNQLIGQIPESLSQLNHLWSLNLSRNALSDPLPSTALSKGIPSLLSIDLSYNKFHLGTIPKWITSRQLTDVHLAGCNLKGLLPNFTKPDLLTSIDLSDNYLNGGFMGFLQKMSNLQKIKLSNNQIRSNLSRLVETASSFLESVDVSKNLITGSIPGTISKLVGLKMLDVSRNRVTGTIPPSLGNLVKLEWLDVSVNAIGGKIPVSLLGIRRLRHANFRANKLCGEVPQGRPFNVFPSAAYAHNLCLCGKPLPPCKKT